jgi:hypothetical protein
LSCSRYMCQYIADFQLCFQPSSASTPFRLCICLSC